MPLDRPLTPAELDVARELVGAAGAARAAPVRARRVGLPAADAHRRPAGADPAARDGDPRRTRARARSPESSGRACSTSARAPARSRSRSPTSTRAPQVTGIDSSADALALAAENVARTGLPVELERHDLFAGLPAGPVGPRRLESAVRRRGGLPALEPEVRDWEPHAALTAEGAVEAVARGARRRARAPAGRSRSRSGRVRPTRRPRSSPSSASSRSSITPDLAGIDRVVEGRLA